MRYDDGCVYEGMLKNGQKSGKGRIKCLGSKNNAKRPVSRIMAFGEGTNYEGEWKDDR